MNTDVTITVMHPDVSEADRAIGCAFAEVYKIEHLMSCTEEGSEVTRLNKNGSLPNASSDLRYVVTKSVGYSELTNGSFDITVLPVINIWKERMRAGSPPTDDEINETLELVNYKNISVGNSSISFSQGSMGITLGGIAKGYAIDRAIEVLKEHHIKHALVNAGGDIRAMGFKTEDESWNVALRNPKNRTEYITVLNLRDMSVATSGNYERYFSEEARASHIIDPKTGYASDELLSATVVAENATDADALATAVFVLGVVDGMELVERLDGVEGLIITHDRRILRSSGFGVFEDSCIP
jgi:thiamine biosynthesis lipoprotein